MSFLTSPEIILFSDTRTENPTNFISNLEKCFFLHILIQKATISMYTGRPHKLKDSYKYKILNLNSMNMYVLNNQSLDRKILETDPNLYLTVYEVDLY